MDILGIKEHDERHDDTERVLRRLVEQVGQLSIDLGQTRTDLRRLYLRVEGTVEEFDVDPALVAANEALGQARAKLTEVRQSANEQWDALNSQLADALEQLQENASSVDSEA